MAKLLVAEAEQSRNKVVRRSPNLYFSTFTFFRKSAESPALATQSETHLSMLSAKTTASNIRRRPPRTTTTTTTSSSSSERDRTTTTTNNNNNCFCNASLSDALRGDQRLFSRGSTWLHGAACAAFVLQRSAGPVSTREACASDFGSGNFFSSMRSRSSKVGDPTQTNFACASSSLHSVFCLFGS